MCTPMYETVGICSEDRAQISQLMYEHRLTKGEAISYYYLVLHEGTKRPCDVCHMTGAYPSVVNGWRRRAINKVKAETDVQ